VDADASVTAVNSIGAVDTNANLGFSITSDSGGNVLVAGRFQGSFTFNGCSTPIVMPDVGHYDGFVAKLTPSLSCIWLNSARSAMAEDFVAAVAVDKDDNAIVAGYLGAGTNNLLGCQVGAQKRGLFVAKLKSAGQCIWAKTFEGLAEPSGVAVDEGQNIVVVGSFDGTLDLGSGKSVTSAANVPSMSPVSATRDAFVVKLDQDGNPLAVRSFGDKLHQGATGVAIDANKDVIVVGEFFGSINLGGKTFSNPNPDPHEELGANYAVGGFIAKLDASLGHVWSTAFASVTAHVLQPSAVALGPGGEVFVTGRFSGSFDFGNGITQSTVGSSFVVKLEP
jgi:hypothetical protein